MRILRLDLIKFGAFADAALDFSAATRERPGLHLIYGPNEAGKSTARRALRCALYGFSQRAEFDFVHDKKDLRVGLTVEDARGQSLAFARRRGNKNTLLDIADGKPISGGMLSRALAGAGSSEEFERAFAIGHEELRAGGEAMLDEENAEEGGSEISRLLFMAATGLSGIRQIERGFIETAAELFKPTGSKPPINQGIAELKKLAKEQHAVEARADEYHDLENRLRESQREHEAYGQELAAARREQTRLGRLEQALPTLAWLRQRQADREELGDVPDLGEEFAKRRLEIQRALELTTGAITQIEQQQARITEQLESIAVRQELLARAQTIDTLHEKLPVHDKEKEDSDRLRGEVAGIEREMRGRLQEIGRTADDLDPHADLLRRQDDARIRKLAIDRDNLADRLTRERAKAKKLRERLDGIERDIETLGEQISLDGLARTIHAATRAGDLDGRIAKLARELREARENEERTRQDVSLWSGNREELSGLEIPDEATIDEFQRRFEQRSRQRERLADRRSTIETARDQARHDLAMIRHDRDVPDEQALQAARARRDLGWREVRREMEGREAGSDREIFLAESGRDSLVEAYELSVRAADTIADRLRHEADTVGKVARYEADGTRCESELARLAEDEREMDTETEALTEEWNRLWSFLNAPPRSPGEMRAWSASLRVARERQAAAIRLEREHQQLEQQREAYRSDVLQELARIPAPSRREINLENAGLSDVLQVAEQVRDEYQAENQRRAALTKELRDLTPELVELEGGIEEATAEWEAAGAEWSRWMAELELPAETSNEAAFVVLDTLSKVDELRRSLKEKHERIEQMRHNREDFTRRIEALLVETAPGHEGSSLENALGEIHRELMEARTQSARRDELRQQYTEAARQIEEKRARLTEWQTDLRLCCQQAGCADAEELPAVEARAARAAELDQRIGELRKDLLDRSGGRPLEAFEEELDAIDADAIPARLAQLAGEIDQLTERDQRVLSEIGRLEQQLATFGGGGAAADIAGQIAAVKARIARQVEQYARARIAARLLREGRERYRKQSSSELLDRASELFAQLTCGAFSRLQVDYGERDRPILLGVRAGDRGRVEPTGMSDGTRDQLYLALRVAWLHAWLDKHDPLPFVVDDLLIHFDDERAAAALRVLSELSDRTQVLFFTHHDHLRDLARDCVPAGNLHEHELHGAFAMSGSADTKRNGRQQPTSRNAGDRELFA